MKPSWQIHTSNQRKVTNIFTKTILLRWPPPTTPRPISPNEPHIRGRALDTLLICSACTVYASSFASYYSAFGSIYTDGGRNPGVLKSPFFFFNFFFFAFWRILIGFCSGSFSFVFPYLFCDVLFLFPCCLFYDLFIFSQRRPSFCVLVFSPGSRCILMGSFYTSSCLTGLYYFKITKAADPCSDIIFLFFSVIWQCNSWLALAFSF